MEPWLEELFFNLSVDIASSLADGTNVRFLGQPGSGRSQTCKTIAEILVSKGHDICMITGGSGATGDWLGPGRPKVPDALSTEKKLHDFAAYDATGRGNRSKPVLIVDDCDLLTPAASMLLSRVAEKRGAAVMRVSCPEQLVLGPPVWPEVTIPAPLMSSREIEEYLESCFDGPVCDQLVGRALAKSGGNPLLVRLLAHSSQAAGLVNRSQGLWRLSTKTLWTPDLIPFVDWRLRHLHPDELVTLASISSAMDPAEISSFDPGWVDSLIARNFLRRLDENDPASLWGVWPALVADRFRISSGANASVNQCQPALKERFARAYRSAVVAKTFQMHSASPLLLRKQRSEYSKTSDVCLVAHSLSDRPEHPNPIDSTMHCVRDALIAIHSGKSFEQARDQLRRSVSLTESGRREGPAAAALLEAISHGIPAESLAELRLSRKQNNSEFIHLAYNLLQLWSGNPALVDLNENLYESTLARDIFGGLVQPLSNFFNGNESSATALLTLARRDALRRADPCQFLRVMYSEMVMSIPRLSWENALEDLRLIRGLGSTSQAFLPSYGATRGLEAFISGFAGPGAGFGSDDTPTGGAGLFLGAEGYGLQFLTAYDSSIDADAAISSLLEKQATHGYLTGAMTSALVAATGTFGPRLAAVIQDLRGKTNLRGFDNITELACILWTGSKSDIDDCARLNLNSPQRALAEGIIQARLRWTKRDGAWPSPITQNTLLELLPNEQSPTGTFTSAAARSHPAVPLTRREREVALLATSLSSPAIAQRLGISTRTVENHIFRAMRKLNVSSRHLLSAAALAAAV